MFSHLFSNKQYEFRICSCAHSEINGNNSNNKLRNITSTEITLFDDINR